MTWLQVNHEPVLIAELKAGLEAALYEIDSDLKVTNSTGIRGWNEDNIKTNKLAHHAIDHWDVPILHTWYRYGQFVPAQEIRPSSLEPKPLSEANLPDSTELQRRGYPNAEEYKGYFLEHDIAHILEQGWFEFLRENYKEYAPTAYRQIYLANLGILELLEELAGAQNPVERADEYYEEFKDYSVDLRAGIASNSRFDAETEEHVRRGIHTIQDILLSLSTRGEDIDDKSAVFRSRNIYHTYIWRWPAFIISKEQARGIDRDNFSQEGQERLENIKGSCESRLRDLREEVVDSELKPTGNDYRQVHGSSQDTLLSLDEALTGSQQDE